MIARELNLMTVAIILLIVLYKESTSNIYGIIISAMNMSIAVIFTISMILTMIVLSRPVRFIIRRLFYKPTSLDQAPNHSIVRVTVIPESRQTQITQ